MSQEAFFACPLGQLKKQEIVRLHTQESGRDIKRVINKPHMFHFPNDLFSKIYHAIVQFYV